MYSWVTCSSIASFVCSSAPKSGDAGSRTWKSIGPCLIWTTTLSSNLPSSVVEVVVGRAGAIVLRVLPVHVVVVDEAAIEHEAAVRRQRARDDVRRVRVRAAVLRGPDASFRIGLQHDAGHVGNRA